MQIIINMEGVLKMLIYEINSIPDLTLSKYQVFADSGIEGMLEAPITVHQTIIPSSIIGWNSYSFYL